MSLRDWWMRRSSSAPMPPALVPPVDEGLEQWVAAAVEVAEGLGPAGRLVVAVMGESLAVPPTSPWFGHEPKGSGLADLFAAVGEDPGVAEVMAAAEVGLEGRLLGVLSEATAQRWRAWVKDAVVDPAATTPLPRRDEFHREAELVWRTAAVGVQSWRIIQLDPDRALRQVRWYPGCQTRTRVGYSDPLNLGTVARSVEENCFSLEEWQALQPAYDLGRREVDPLAWRLSSLAFAAEVWRGEARD